MSDVALEHDDYESVRAARGRSVHRDMPPRFRSCTSPDHRLFCLSRCVVPALLAKPPADSPARQLPERVHPAIHMLAGAMAGMGEHLALYPVDVVKTRMMRMNPDPEARYYSIRHAVKKMVRTEVCPAPSPPPGGRLVWRCRCP